MNGLWVIPTESHVIQTFLTLFSFSLTCSSDVIFGNWDEVGHLSPDPPCQQEFNILIYTVLPLIKTTKITKTYKQISSVNWFFLDQCLLIVYFVLNLWIQSYLTWLLGQVHSIFLYAIDNFHISHLIKVVLSEWSGEFLSGVS